MKESCSLSKENLVLPEEIYLYHQKNGFSNTTKVRGKFGSIFKFLICLLLTIFLILIAYMLLNYYKTGETQIRFCGTLDVSDDDEMTVQPTEELRIMTNKTEKKIIDFLQRIRDSTIGDYESEYDYSTVSTVIQDTENEAVTRMMTSKPELLDTEDENNIVISKLDVKEFSTLHDTFLSFTTETPQSDFNEEITDSLKYNSAFDNIESLGISPDEITWRDPEENSSEENNEEFKISIMDFLFPQRSFFMKVRDEIDESDLESKDVYYDTFPTTSTYLDNDALDPDYTNLEEAEQLDPIPLPSKRKNCEILKNDTGADTNTEIANSSCESDEDTLTVAESPSDSKYSTKELYGDLDEFKIFWNFSSFNDNYFVRNHSYWGDDRSDKTKSYEEYNDYYDYMKDYEEESNKKIQGKNTKEDDVFEEDFFDKIFETPEEPTSKSNDEQVSDEDTDFDQTWDELFSRLHTVHEDDTLSMESFSEKIESNYFEILCMIVNVTLKYMKTHPAVEITDGDRQLMKSQIPKLRNVTEMCDNIYNSNSRSVLNYMITEISELHWDESETESHKVKRSVGSKIHDNSMNRLINEEKPAEMLDNAIQMKKMMLLQKLEQIDESYYQSLESNLEEFFNRMELLSQHIDRLHERYLKMNELSDDYISKEFPTS